MQAHHKVKERVIVAFLVAAALLFTSCGPDVAASRHVPVTTSVTPVAPASPALKDSTTPIRIAVFVDQSTSMGGARVSPVAASDFTVVHDRIRKAGGELAVGLIRDESDRPFVRLFVSSPPEMPTANSARPTNVFAAAAAKQREDADRARVEEARKAWQADIAAREASFARAVEPLLARAADAPATDIWSALRRADVFLTEPNSFARPSKNVIVLVSDGVETAAPQAGVPRFSASAELLLVNGAGEIGALAPLAPVRFESLEAALRYAIAEGGSCVRR